MAKEIELKLRLTPENTVPLAHWLDQHLTASGEKRLMNDYYDTPDLLLQRNRAAMRVRATGSGYEQTLKTRGRSVAGMHVRGEWNWPLATGELDISLLQDPEVAECLPSDSDLSTLEKVFGTHFRRRCWLAGEGSSRIEVVIDEGEVVAGATTQPLCETELELLSGDPADLWQLVSQMQQQAPLWLSDISKAERGYHQAGKAGQWLPPQVDDSDWSAFLSSSLTVLQRAVESRLFDPAGGAADALWRAGYPLWCVLNGRPAECLARLLPELTDGVPDETLSAAQSLTELSRLLYEMCQSSQDSPADWQSLVREARSTLADMIECGNGFTTLIRE